MKPEAERRTDGASGITGEIEKYLSGESQYSGPSVKGLQGAGVAEDGVGGTGQQGVGQHDFLEHAERHQQESPAKLAGAERRRHHQLRQKISRADDRAGHQLWKK